MAISQHQFYLDRRLTKVPVFLAIFFFIFNILFYFYYFPHFQCQVACNRSAEEIIACLSANRGRSVVPLRKRYSITTFASSNVSVSGGGLSRRFSSLGSIHSTTPSSGCEVASLTNSLHSLSSSSSSSTTSSPSALSLVAAGAAGGVGAALGDHHLWEVTSDSASLFSGRGVATFSSSLSTFRHSARASSSSAMSRSSSAVARSSRSLCYRRLRLLETQLNAKLEEVKKLDALEQVI